MDKILQGDYGNSVIMNTSISKAKDAVKNLGEVPQINILSPSCPHWAGSSQKCTARVGGIGWGRKI